MDEAASNQSIAVFTEGCHYGNGMGIIWQQMKRSVRRCCDRLTHQICAHGALCQHERTFRHQENLNVGKTGGLLLIVILLRVVRGAASLCANLAFNLHPSGSGSAGVGRRETEGVRPGVEHLVRVVMKLSYLREEPDRTEGLNGDVEESAVRSGVHKHRDRQRHLLLLSSPLSECQPT